MNVWQEWPLVISALALVFAAAGYFLNRVAQYLTLREHNEFKTLILNQMQQFHTQQEKRITTEHFDDVMDDIRRSVDKAESMLETRIADLRFLISEHVLKSDPEK